MSTPPRRNVTFELPKAEFDALEIDAEACHADSRHQRARDIVIGYLSNQEATDVQEAIERIDCEIAYLQELVRKLTYSVIVHAAGKPSEVANQWIREHMPSRPA